jgi:hypothetical protein
MRATCGFDRPTARSSTTRQSPSSRRARGIANGLPPGIAFQDGVAALHEDENLVEIMSAREDACVFRVDRSEHQLGVMAP